MPPETETTATPEQTIDKGKSLEVESPNSEPSIGDVLKALRDLKDQTEGRFKQFGQDLGRLRGKVKGTGEPAQTQETSLTTDVTSIVAQAMELGQIRGSLVQEDRAALDEAIQGLDAPVALAVAKAFAKRSPVNGGAVDSTGQARSPKPPSPKPTHPTTVAEYMAIRQKAKAGDKTAQARVEAMDRDPDFDPASLSRRPAWS